MLNVFIQVEDFVSMAHLSTYYRSKVGTALRLILQKVQFAGKAKINNFWHLFKWNGSEGNFRYSDEKTNKALILSLLPIIYYPQFSHFLSTVVGVTISRHKCGLLNIYVRSICREVTATDNENIAHVAVVVSTRHRELETEKLV